MSARIRVRLTPRGGQDAIEGWREGVLLVRVAAAPVDGKANEALVRLVARALGVAASRVSLVAGAQGRTKTLAVEGMDETAVRAALG